jgi:hypothetical protein
MKRLLFGLIAAVWLGATPGTAAALDILLTNDDGFDSPGITALHAALVAAGHSVTLVAPAEQQSGKGGSLNTEVFDFTPGVGLMTLANHGGDVWSLAGTPVDSVKAGLDIVLAGSTPDLIVSGLNFGQNIGKPGTGFYYLNNTDAIGGRGGRARDYEAPRTANGPAPVSQMDIPALLRLPDAIRAYLVWNCNPVASNPEQASMRQGLAREDLFTVVVDCFQTDTADYADIVLPAASFLEFDDLSSSYFELMIGPQVKCQEPLGDSLPNQEIFRRLARAMGFEDLPLYEDDRTMIDDALQACGAGLDWETLKDKGWAYVSGRVFEIDGGFRF